MTGRLHMPGFEEQCALGLCDGWESFRKFGMNPDVAVSTLEEMWPLGTVRQLPTAAGAVTLVSSSTADDADPAGTGAWTVEIQGLDANYLEQSETFSMDGTTPVVGSKSFLRVFRAFVTYTGSGGVNAGNITGSIGGNNLIYIEANEGQSHLAAGTVPADKYFLINYYTVGVGRMAGNTDCQIFGQIRLYDATATNNHQSWRTISDVWVYNGQEHTNSVSRTILPPRTDYRVAILSSATTQAHAIVGGYLVKTDTVGRY